MIRQRGTDSAEKDPDLLGCSDAPRGLDALLYCYFADAETVKRVGLRVNDVRLAALDVWLWQIF